MHHSIINSSRELKAVVLSFPFIFTLLKVINLNLDDSHIPPLTL